MSILVDKEIREAIAKKEIVIDPYDSTAVKPAAYYFKLGKSLLFPKENQTITLERGKDPEYEKIDISAKSYIIKPKQFLLAQTHEAVTIAKNIVMFIDGRSTLARLGLSIHQTATIIYPGHTDSIITLEIFNAGKWQIEIKAGINIAKGIFFRSDTPADVAYKDIGIYSSQREVLGADVPPYKDNL
jgi:dCTP deaminase